MQVTETLSQGLRREFRVVLPASDLTSRVHERLTTMKDRVRINGFRPGKVPVEHLKRLYGRAAMVEALEAAVQDATSQIVSDRGLKLATEPKVTMPQDQALLEGVIAGKSDLDYTVAIEILPEIKLADFKDIALEKPVAPVSDMEIDEAVGRIVQQNRPYSVKAADQKSEKDDRVVISFVGRIDGNAFDGGTGEDVAVQIGSGTFIPGFEDQLIGIGTGEQRQVFVTFPQNYLSEKLAGKAAVFDVTAKSIESPGKVTIDDAFAKGLGLDSLTKLKDAVKTRIEQEHAVQTRNRLKLKLLDALDERHKFEVSPSLAEQEFDNVWRAVTSEMQSEGKTFADEGTTEEAAREDYKKIADRRVRLGLVISEIGERNGIKVTEEELNRALAERVRQFPGQEQRIFDYYRKNPTALASLRGPIYEDKVIDFLLELAKVTEKTVTREELFKTEDDTSAA
ncbi:MAG: trigger factor [Rhizobiales bacterium]|nr:trigger factor [Hyphomicrobiales bacterium]